MSSGHRRIVVMGVSGAGKSTIGEAVAKRCDLPFVDADSLHSPANIAKMHRGDPLTDEDRFPWLQRVGEVLQDADGGIIVACSALRRSYRDQVRRTAPAAIFVHLTASRDVLRQRLGARSGHFMPAELLDSQLATLEPLDGDEAGVSVDVGGMSVDETVEAVLNLPIW